MTSEEQPAERQLSQPNGLQLERTVLAWQRTGFSFLACGLVLSHGVVIGHFNGATTALAAVLAAVGVTICALRAKARRNVRLDRLRPPETWLLAILAAVITASGVASLWVA